MGPFWGSIEVKGSIDLVKWMELWGLYKGREDGGPYSGDSFGWIGLHRQLKYSSCKLFYILLCLLNIM